MPPFFSQLPIGWISEESTRRQKSFLLSDPSNLSRRREPVKPTTVAMQVDVVLRGSWASSFIPALNSLGGGAGLYARGREDPVVEQHSKGERNQEEPSLPV